MTDDPESLWKEADVAKSRYCLGYYLDELRRTTKTSVRIASVPYEIQTEHLLNMSLQHYQHTNPLSEIDKWLQRTVMYRPS
jgi:hypothetical protein